MQRIVIVALVLALLAALFWPWLVRLPLGHLPGDVHYVRDGLSIHFPIVTCLVLSLAMSLLAWVFRR